jgi:RHS repeat-associated protein
VDLSPFAGKTINWMWITADSQTLPGAYDMYFQDLALVSADGTVRRIYSRDKSIALTPFSSSGVSGQTYAVNHFPGAGPYVPETTVYYHGDHLGSSRLMTAYEGFPIWEATYLPFGQEHAAGGAPPLAPSSNHYKFTGKERDTESGLDYFGARYYSSAHGRFLSMDPENAGATLGQPKVGTPITTH